MDATQRARMFEVSCRQGFGVYSQPFLQGTRRIRMGTSHKHMYVYVYVYVYVFTGRGG